jgi:hypothetical protein
MWMKGRGHSNVSSKLFAEQRLFEFPDRLGSVQIAISDSGVEDGAGATVPQCHGLFKTLKTDMR